MLSNPQVVDSMRKASEIGQEQFEGFWNERILAPTNSRKPLNDPIKLNKLPLMKSITKPTGMKTGAKFMKEERIKVVQMLLAACAGRTVSKEIFIHENRTITESQ